MSKLIVKKLLIENCGECPYYHIGEAEIGYKPKGICTFGEVRDWKRIPVYNVYYKVLDDCPIPITLTTE